MEKLYRKIILVSGIIFCGLPVLKSQHIPDSATHKTIRRIDIDGQKLNPDLIALDSVKGTWIFSGKKSEQILLTQKDAGLSEKYGRQIFAKIPGIFVYDMDGTGNQVNISTRGLDPHRGWEFNIRKDGILTNSDMYGYPASHYNIPMEAVEKIELVRGTGALQYGAQFGGMLNYLSKGPDTARKFAFENVSTAGSYGLLSSFMRFSGTLKKFSYNVWLSNKSLDGYRKNSQSEYDAQNISLFYKASDKLQLKLEFTHSNYTIQLAGPLTDSMFKLDPRMSTRSRNYYNPNIFIPNFSVQFRPSKKLQILLNSSAVLGTRNSVMFDKPANVSDSIVTATDLPNPRQVDIDNFNSYTQELRFIYTWKTGHKLHHFAAGYQRMDNNLHRRQQGKGSTGSDFDLSLANGSTFARDLHYLTKNNAFFAENLWSINTRLSINTGIRVEMGETHMSGTIGYYPTNQIPNSIVHKFPLLGTNFQYQITHFTQIYGGISQAYRPVIFKDIIPASVYEIADKNLKDAKGYNAEIGCRGRYRWLRWDVSAYQLVYQNRLGTLAQKDSLNHLILFRTNIGNSLTRGIESFLQTDFKINKNQSISVFNSTAYTHAIYVSATIRSGNENKDISGNFVESTPKIISRTGLTWKLFGFSASVLYSYTASSFADAMNAEKPNASGATGLVPSYQLIDFNATWRVINGLKIMFNLNNILNTQYFTKRPQFYPGPGIWPSDGRTYSVSLAITL